MQMSGQGQANETPFAALSAIMAQGAALRAQCDDYDVVVIGAGVVGCCTARELSRWDVRVLVIEAGLDLACGSTRANSGVVHAGFDPLPGTMKARYNVRGAKMFPRLQQELGFAYQKNGALVVAFSEEEKAVLANLFQRGKENGAPDMTIIDQAALRELEPLVSDQAIAALHVPESAICDPYGLTFACAENAASNGVEFLFGCTVESVSKAGDGYTVVYAGGQVRTRCVVNAAGIHADEINNMVSANKLSIAPRRGEYVLYDSKTASPVHTIFPVPGVSGKGVLVGKTAFGNPFIGPNAQPQASKTEVPTTSDGIAEILEKGAALWPSAPLSGKPITTSYAGLRASNGDGSDFVIGEAEDASGFFNAACIDSPGLSSAPAIAEDLAQMVAQKLGATENASFCPKREGYPIPWWMPDEAKNRLIQADSGYGKMVCRCYHVTEGEITKLLHGPIPVLTFDALKWRTGVMMGPCQGGQCMARIAQIVMRELGVTEQDLMLTRNDGSKILANLEAATTTKDAAPFVQPAGRLASRIQDGPIPSSCDVLILGSTAEAIQAVFDAAERSSGSVVWALSDAKELAAGRLALEMRMLSQDESIDMSHMVDVLLSADTVTVFSDVFVLEGADGSTSAKLLTAHGVITCEAKAVRSFRRKGMLSRAGLGIVGERGAGVYSGTLVNDLLDNFAFLPGTAAVVNGLSAKADTVVEKLKKAGVEIVARTDGQDVRIASLAGAKRLESVTIEAAQECTSVPCDLLVLA